VRRGTRLLGVAAAGVLMWGWWQPVWSAPTTAGFVVSPAFENVTVRADQRQVEYNLKISNRNAADQNFRLSVVDFGSLDEQGGVAFLGQPTSELEHKYGLASWMKLEKDAVFVPAGTSTQVMVTVDNRESLAPGGHYGAVLVTAVTENGQPSGDRVGVRQVLSSLVLATKEGGGAPGLRLAGQTANGGFWRLPSLVEQRYQNTGNVHVTPRGVVAVKDPRGVVVARGVINEGSNVILPESFRRYKTAVRPVGLAWLPGRYVVEASYRYDGTDQFEVQRLGIWYVGAAIVWVVAGLAVVAAIVLAWWLFWRPRWRRKRLAN
jgi:hypothetical protein